MALPLRLPIPRHKATARLILPSCLFVAGFAIFLCGLMRTYYIGETLSLSEVEEKNMKALNEHMEWWAGFPVIASSVLAMIAVMYDKPLLLKLSVFATGTCFVVLTYCLIWDAGEFSWIAYAMSYVETLKDEGYICTTKKYSLEYNGHNYTYRECACEKMEKISMGLWIPYSCELLHAQYYLQAFLSFALASSLGFSLCTLLSFVLVLKSISQSPTGLNLDEKPLSEDFFQMQEDGVVES